MTGLTEQDHEQLRQHGISTAEAKRQLELLHSPPAPSKLERACTLKDGIEVLDPEDEDLLKDFDQASQGERITRFIPASGAATRMFRGLREALASSSPEKHEDAARLLSCAHELPFGHLLPIGDKATPDQLGDLLEAIVGEEGLGLAELPKALIPFHRYESETGPEPRTAFLEHLVESATLESHPGLRKAHFTVPEAQRYRFQELLEEKRSSLETRHGCTFQVRFSSQHKATDTLAVFPETGEPVRTPTGELLLRPGGHGSLLRNLQDLANSGGDLITIRNIDNIRPESRHAGIHAVRRVLVGKLVALERERNRLLGFLESSDASLQTQTEDQARLFLIESFWLPAGFIDTMDRDELIDRLDRPIRVSGAVRNQGDPGGGPFFVANRPEIQIVESAQIDTHSDQQRLIYEHATHFNPAELACAVRDANGKPYDLSQFVDESAAFVTEKSFGERSLRALEHPGLWNGSMAGWNTTLVEVPRELFAPVKTLFDLLREAHRV